MMEPEFHELQRARGLLTFQHRSGCMYVHTNTQNAFVKKYADRQVKRGVDGKSATAGGRSVWLCSEDLSSTPAWQYHRLGPALFVG